MRFWTVFILLCLGLGLASCYTSGGRTYAKALFPDVQVSRVLGYKKIFARGYGCTYVIVKTAPFPSPAPPEVVLQERGYHSNFAAHGAWQKTPVPEDTDLSDRAYCLTGWPDKVEGAGLEGYGEQIAEILTKPDAWFSVYGSGEHQILMVYAPQERLVVRLRFGD